MECLFEIRLPVLQLCPLIIHRCFQMTLKFIDKELPVPGFFHLLHFCSTVITTILDRPTWHLIHNYKSKKCSCRGYRILQIGNPAVVIYSRL